jgi:hypothetical protein
VFGWWGDDLAPGTYPIARLSMSAMEAEEMSSEHAFYGWGAVRTTGENLMIVVESGSLTIDAVESGRISGSFELTGFALEGNARGAALEWAGNFSGVEGEPL